MVLCSVVVGPCPHFDLLLWKIKVKINLKLNLLLVFNFSAKKKLMQGEMTTFMKKIVKIGKIARYPYKAKKRNFFSANC